MSKRILFLYISASSGHQRAAESVMEGLSLLAPDIKSVGVDSFTFVYPRLGKIISKTYLEVLRHTPILWDYLYDNPDVESATRELRDLLNLISAPKLKQLVHQHMPEVLVCTQAVPCGVFAREKRRGKLHIPLVAVITDFAIHSYWVYPEVDLYCVPSEDVRKDLIRRGIQAERVVVTGIPINPSFLRQIPPEKARAALGLHPEKFTVLVMGGSQGLGPVKELCETLKQLPVQTIVVTGLNKKLYRSIHQTYHKDQRFHLVGYTKNISTLMDAADVLITKPGGLTSSEALAKNLPLLITQPIPGQEERNAIFLSKQGVAERADELTDIKKSIENYLHHPLRLRKMKEKTELLAKPYAAIEIARFILRYLKPQRA